MSGGPVFNSAGRVCGLVCDSLKEAEDAEDYVSWMVSLWPAVGIVLAGWRPNRISYTLLDAIRAGEASARNSDRVSIKTDANGEQQVSFLSLGT